MEDHVRGCPECEAELEAYGRLSRRLDPSELPRLSPESRRRLRRNVHAAGARRLRFGRWLTAAAAAVFVVAVSQLYLAGRHPGGATPGGPDARPVDQRTVEPATTPATHTPGRENGPGPVAPPHAPSDTRPG